MSSVKIGEILVKQGLLTPEQFQAAADEQRKSSTRFTNAVISLGFLRMRKFLEL